MWYVDCVNITILFKTRLEFSGDSSCYFQSFYILWDIQNHALFELVSAVLFPRS